MSEEIKHNWGAILGGIAALVVAITGLVVALRPPPQSKVTPPPPGSSEVSCKDYQKRSGFEWKVACNENTAAGFYWHVDKRIAPYGFYGLRAIDGSPSCKNLNDIDSSALTASWKDVSDIQGFWTVSRNYCRIFDPKLKVEQCTHALESQDIFKNKECEASSHCGVYHVLCKKIPDTH